MSEEKEFKVKIGIIRTIYDSMLPIHYRLNSLLEDAVLGTLLLNDFEKSVLLEYCSCTSALKILFENYFDRVEETGEPVLTIPKTEYLTILSMSKAAEVATRTTFGLTAVWDH